MKFTNEKDLNSFQKAALKPGAVPTQERTWEALSSIATVALEYLSNPEYGREGFSIPKVKIFMDELVERGVIKRSYSIGTFYNLFDKPEKLIDFVWPWRSEMFFTPLPVMPAFMVEYLNAVAKSVEDERAERTLAAA